VDTSAHFDVTIEKLRETGGAGKDRSSSTDELAGGSKGLIERFLELIPPERIGSGSLHSCVSMSAAVPANREPR
jgi:hypothetical protein